MIPNMVISVTNGVDKSVSKYTIKPEAGTKEYGKMLKDIMLDAGFNEKIIKRDLGL